MAKPLSLLDIMRGVGGGHRALAAAVPDAQRIPPTMRQAQKFMLPKSIVDQYNDAGIFGKTESGEPIRATMSSSNQDAVKRGFMPHSGRIRLDPESKVPKDLDEAHARGNYPSIEWHDTTVRPGKELLGSELFMRMQKAARGDPQSQSALDRLARSQMPSPIMTEIDAMNVKPEGYRMNPDSMWWKNLPAKGKEMYALLYDLHRAQGHGNAAKTLTDVNKARRLGNVASHSIGHGDTGFISPINEMGYDPGLSTQLFHYPVRSRTSEEEYLQNLFRGKGMVLNDQTRSLMSEAGRIQTPDLAKMSPDEILGLLFLREAQLAGAYGPSGSSTFRFNHVKPYDNPGLKALAEPHVLSNLDTIEGAMGPATLGRQGTTEAIVRGLMQDVDPDTVVKMLLDKAPPGGFKGRYKKGGLAHVAVTS